MSLVIPKLTRQWQDHQKELEIQTSLVGSMSKSVSDAVISGRMLASGLYQGREWQRVYNDSIRTWSIDGSVTGAKLQAYYPGSDVGSRWQLYGLAVANYLLLAAPSGYRADQVRQIHDYLPRLQIGWSVLARGGGGATYQRAYVLLGFELLDRRDELVRRVLDAHPSGF